MKVALIGAHGQLGRDIEWARPEGVELVSLTRSDLDLAQVEKIREFFLELKPQVIINTAAYHHTESCEDHLDQAFLINGTAVRALAQVCLELDSTLLHISTDYVFSGDQRDRAYSEEDQPRPISAYGIAKYTGELFVQSLVQKYYILRISSLFGKAGSGGKGNNFVYTMLKMGQKQKTIRVIDDMYMSPTYAKDSAELIWKLLMERRDYGIYHGANQGICNWFDFAKKIFEVAKWDGEVIPISHTEYPTKVQRPMWSPLKSEKIILRPWQSALTEFVRGVIEGGGTPA